MIIISNKKIVDGIPELPSKYAECSSYKKEVVIGKAEKIFGVQFSKTVCATLDVFLVDNHFIFMAILLGSDEDVSPSGRVTVDHNFELYEVMLEPSDLSDLLN